MSKTLEDLLLNRIIETYDGNSKSNEYSQGYIKHLLRARDIDMEIDDGLVEPKDLYAYLVKFCQSNDDEITINYPDDQSITLDFAVAKELITYISTEDIELAAMDIDMMHNIISRVYNNIVVIEDNE